jgi:hypothetical protein
MTRWVFAALLALLVVGGIATAIYAGDGWDHHHNEVTRVVDGNGTETIVVHDGRPFFFPFGFLFIPLAFFLIFGLMRALFWRGPWGGGGPWNGNPRARFEEWHRQAHQSPGAGETRAE